MKQNLDNRIRILAIIGLLGLLSYPLSAQQQRWRLADGTSGIHIAAIDVYRNDPDTLYASW